MANNISDENIEYLIRGILTLQNTKECLSFFEDLCTVSELQEMSRRMQAARMLRASAVYADIAAETGLSTATISRVNRCCNYGTGGYAKILERIGEKK